LFLQIYHICWKLHTLGDTTGFAGILLMVGKGGEVGKLRGGIRDGGVERQHEAVGAVHLAVGVAVSVTGVVSVENLPRPICKVIRSWIISNSTGLEE
jgi:hypothetical protein